MESGIHNTSEIGRLRKVMLHRPGGELENLMPEYLERLLFDDIPYLREAQREHDAFAECLRSQGVEVVYLTDLVVQSLTDGFTSDGWAGLINAGATIVQGLAEGITPTPVDSLGFIKAIRAELEATLA